MMDVSIGSRTEQHSSTGLILGTVEISFFLSVSSRCLLQGESPSLSTLISSYQILSSERLFPLKSFHGYQGHQHLVTRQGTFREKEEGPRDPELAPPPWPLDSPTCFLWGSTCFSALELGLLYPMGEARACGKIVLFKRSTHGMKFMFFKIWIKWMNQITKRVTCFQV